MVLIAVHVFYFYSFSSNGVGILRATVPDSITSWVASAFAVNSNTGFGVAPSTANVCLLLL